MYIMMYAGNILFCHLNIAGLPRFVRTDRGTENVKVAFLQPFLRRNGQDVSAGTKSFQYGKSVSNQVGDHV